jgi:hypothetical protein
MEPSFQPWKTGLTHAVTAQLAMERLNERIVGQESRELPREEVPDFGRRRFDLFLDGGATIDDGDSVLKVMTEKVASATIREGLELGRQEAG